jgi:hypothetical protein
MKRNLGLSLFLSIIASVVTLPACVTRLTYTAEPMEAKVIDADTKEPLEGVIVVANWQLETGTAGGNYPAGQLMVMEAVTDKAGKFSFPGFGPKTVWDSFLIDKDPELLLFKSGYNYLRLTNPYDSTRELRTHSIRRSVWNGKSIELKPFKGPLAEYKRHFDDWNTDLDQIVSWNPKECNWKKLPEAILATERERKEILAQAHEQAGINPHTVGSLYQDILRNNDWFTKNGGLGCGSPKEFFQRYKP